MTVCIYRDIHTLQPYIIDFTQRGCHTLRFINDIWRRVWNIKISIMQFFQHTFAPLSHVEILLSALQYPVSMLLHNIRTNFQGRADPAQNRYSMRL